MCKVNSVYPLIFRILDSCLEMLLLNRCLSWSCYIKMNSIDLLSACCFFEVTFFFFFVQMFVMTFGDCCVHCFSLF